MGDTVMAVDSITGDRLVEPADLEVDKEVISQLAEVAEMMTEMVGAMVSSRQVHSQDLKHFRQELQGVRDSLRRIHRVLMEGNGQKPLISRVAVLEEKMANVEETLEDSVKQKANNEQISRRGKYAIGVAALTGLLALASALVSLFGS